MLLYAMNRLGLYATFYPVYGASKRGGFSQCSITGSDQPVYSFTSDRFDLTVVLNEDSYKKYGEAVVPGGVLIYNSSLIPAPEGEFGYKVIGVPFDEMARKVGDQKVMNTLVFGFTVAYLGLLDRKTAREIVMSTTGSKEAYREMNLRALDAGFEYAKAS